MKKKKVPKIVLIVAILLIILIVAFIVYPYLKQEYEISKLPDYYQDLAENCKELKKLGISGSSTNCCLESATRMAEGNFDLIYLLYPGEMSQKSKCPEGFKANTLRCKGGYEWCEPA